jgi:phage repressor protein C with HTH and peptisase S24 domain
MAPTLPAGKLVVAVRARRAKAGDIVILWHDDMRKIKRVQAVRDDRIFVVGDNQASTDSRDFGWLPQDAILAKLIWPKLNNLRID